MFHARKGERHGVTSRSDDFLINFNKITDTHWYKYNACAYQGLVAVR